MRWDGRIIWKCVLQEQLVWMWSGLNWLRICSIVLAKLSFLIRIVTCSFSNTKKILFILPDTLHLNGSCRGMRVRIPYGIDLKRGRAQLVSTFQCLLRGRRSIDGRPCSARDRPNRAVLFWAVTRVEVCLCLCLLLHLSERYARYSPINIALRFNFELRTERGQQFWRISADALLARVPLFATFLEKLHCPVFSTTPKLPAQCSVQFWDHNTGRLGGVLRFRVKVNW